MLRFCRCQSQGRGIYSAMRSSGNYPLLQPRVLSAQHFHCDLVDGRIIRPKELLEMDLDPIACLETECVGEGDGLGSPLLRQHLCSHASRRHCKQLGANIYRAEQDHLSPLELRTEANHRMENRSSEMTSCPLDVADVTRQFAELAVASEPRRVQPARRIPRQVERRCVRQS